MFHLLRTLTSTDACCAPHIIRIRIRFQWDAEQVSYIIWKENASIPCLRCACRKHLGLSRKPEVAVTLACFVATTVTGGVEKTEAAVLQRAPLPIKVEYQFCFSNRTPDSQWRVCANVSSSHYHVFFLIISPCSNTWNWLFAYSGPWWLLRLRQCRGSSRQGRCWWDPEVEQQDLHPIQGLSCVLRCQGGQGDRRDCWRVWVHPTIGHWDGCPSIQGYQDHWWVLGKYVCDEAQIEAWSRLTL